MTVDFTDVVRLVLASGILVTAFILRRFREEQNRYYAVVKCKDPARLALRLALTNLLRISSALISIAVLAKLIDLFVGIYILFPILIALHIIIFKYSDRIKGFMTFIKGVYYCGLILMAMLHYWYNSESTEILILGFTLAIAVFESITAIFDGCEKMKKNNL